MMPGPSAYIWAKNWYSSRKRTNPQNSAVGKASTNAAACALRLTMSRGFILVLTKLLDLIDRGAQDSTLMCYETSNMFSWEDFLLGSPAPNRSVTCSYSCR